MLNNIKIAAAIVALTPIAVALGIAISLALFCAAIIAANCLSGLGWDLGLYHHAIEVYNLQAIFGLEG